MPSCFILGIQGFYFCIWNGYGKCNKKNSLDGNITILKWDHTLIRLYEYLLACYQIVLIRSLIVLDIKKMKEIKKIACPIKVNKIWRKYLFLTFVATITYDSVCDYYLLIYFAYLSEKFFLFTQLQFKNRPNVVVYKMSF